jgi:hypothetical protein
LTMANTNSPQVVTVPGRRRTASFWLLAFLTACFCAFVLSLPVFPSEDGPIHLYFATVLGDLLSHSSPLYAQYYYVHHLLPPYSLHYYLLIVLMKLVSATTAEKLFVCLIMTNFAYGFRYLATGVGQAGDVLSLAVVALLFNWPLGMGFENFSLSLGMACWALGLWARIRKPASDQSTSYRAGFIALLALMTLTHPVPVIITVGFAAFDLVLGTLAEWLWKSPGNGWRNRSRDVFTLLGGASTLAYISFYTDKKRSLAEAPQHLVPLAELIHYGNLYGIAFFGGTSLGAKLYRGSLYSVLIVGVVLALGAAMQQLRTRTWSTQLSWCASFLFFIPALCLLPPDMNGSHFFAERLVIIVWLSVLAAASGHERLSKGSAVAIGVATTCIAILVLSLGQTYLRPEARQLAKLEAAPLVHQQVGLLLPGNAQRYEFKEPLNFYPMMWAGTYFFRESGSVLLNTPWMDLPIMPLGARPPLLTATVPLVLLESYEDLRTSLMSSPGMRANTLPRADFILFSGPADQPKLSDIKPILDFPVGHPWQCTAESAFTLCRH